MSRMQLMKTIEEVNKELCSLISYHNYNLQVSTIIKCSQKLDLLISAYMKESF